MVEVRPEVVDPRVVGLSGGPKQSWLRMHRGEVLTCYHECGPEYTMLRFNMRGYTLRNFLVSKPVDYEKLTKADRAIKKAEVAIEAVREVKHRLNDVEAQLEELAPMAQIAYGFLEAVARAMPVIELKESLERQDPLRLSDMGKSRKNEAKDDAYMLCNPES